MLHLHDRTEAGRLLADKLEKYQGAEAVVFALPRGGVVIGIEISKHLHIPLDLIIPRKIGHPFNPEFAVCAVTENGPLVCNREVAEELDQKWLDEEVRKEQAEARRRRLVYRAGRPEISVVGKTTIIADDGIATGLTMLAAIQEVRARRPDKIIVAVPVVPADAVRELEAQGAGVVALEAPEAYLGSVGSYYDRFEQVEDQEVLNILTG